MKDDTDNFKTQKIFDSISLYHDKDILKLSRELLHRLDKYRYSYLWTAGGLPIIQTPADIVIMQEIIWKTKPTVIIETGIARGGSLINSAMCLELNGGAGRVIGIDIDIREHNKMKILNHKFSNRIELFEGSSDSENIYNQVKDSLEDTDKVMVVLDSNHSFSHVLNELKLWANLVTKGCYLVVADTMLYYAKEPIQGSVKWVPGDDPLSALNEFLKLSTSNRFVIDEEINGKLIFSGSYNGFLKAN